MINEHRVYHTHEFSVTQEQLVGLGNFEIWLDCAWDLNYHLINWYI